MNKHFPSFITPFVLIPVFLLASQVLQAQLFYRSNATGNWNATSTWQSSSDGSTWSGASSTPSSSDNAITIRAGHTVTINSAVSLDQTTIEAGGVLVYGSGGSLTINNGTGDDLIIFGTFRHNVGADAPYSSATIRIKTGGVLEVNINSPSASHYGLSTQLYYENGSTFYWNVSTSAFFLSASTTYFPNSSTSEIPTFRVNTPSINVGAGTPTTINGIFQVDANTVTWQNSGAKIFRNGITGAGTVTQASTSGEFQITGTATSIASNTLNLSTGGLNVASTAVVNLDANETITEGTVTVNGQLYCSDKIISGTANFTLNASGTLGIGSTGGIASSGASGNIQVTGSRTFNAAIYIYNGTATQITGTGLPASVAGLTINNANNVTLTNSCSVSTALSLTSGVLTLGSNTLTLGSSGTLTGGSASSYLSTTGTGVFKRTVGTSATFYPIGTSTFTPAWLTRSSGSDVFNIRVLNGVYSNGFMGTPITTFAVNRTWDVTADNIVGSLTLQVQWNVGEHLPSFSIVNCLIAHYRVGIWNLDLPSNASGTNPYTQTRTGINALSPFAVVNSAALPVELAAFQAQKTSNTTLLTWRTLSESNSDHFQIERSTDGRSFDPLGRVEAAGFSTQAIDYRFVDTAPVKGINYYRLRQVDFDGTFTYSPVVSVEMDAPQKVTLYPTIAQHRTTLRFAEASTENRQVLLFDALGRLVTSYTPDAAALDFELPLDGLPAGHYFIKILEERSWETLRLVKQ